MGFEINHQRQTSASRFVPKIRAAAVCSALACLGMAWNANAAPGDSAQQPLVVAFQGGADSLDPVSRSVTVAYSWQRHIFDTIVHLDNNGTLGPRIATAWENINPKQ